MNAMPQNVSVTFYRTAQGQLVAAHNIQCGPVDHLEPQYLTQLANLFWNRNRTGINGNQRLTGSVANSSVDLTATDARENSTDSPAVPSVANVVSVDGSGNINGQMIHSAPMIANILGATTPTPVSGASATDIKTMQPREVLMCDTSGNQFYAIVHCTAGYTKS